MRNKRQRLYEGMYIINANLSEDARNKALQKITGSIEANGGKILKIHDMGKKRLAYEIDKKREGYYFLVYFEIETPMIAQLWKEYHLNEDLIRFMTLKADSVLEKLEFKSLATRN